MHDQNIYPLLLIEWMWDNVMQNECNRWMTITDTDISHAEVLALYKESLKMSKDDTH